MSGWWRRGGCAHKCRYLGGQRASMGLCRMMSLLRALKPRASEPEGDADPAKPSASKTPKTAVPICPAAGGKELGDEEYKEEPGHRPQQEDGRRTREHVRLEASRSRSGATRASTRCRARRRSDAPRSAQLTDGWSSGVAASMTSRSRPVASRVCATSPRTPAASAWTTYIAGSRQEQQGGRHEGSAATSGAESSQPITGRDAISMTARPKSDRPADEHRAAPVDRRVHRIVTTPGLQIRDRIA